MSVSADGYIISTVTDVWGGSLGTKGKSQSTSLFPDERFKGKL